MSEGLKIIRRFPRGSPKIGETTRSHSGGGNRVQNPPPAVEMTKLSQNPATAVLSRILVSLVAQLYYTQNIKQIPALSC